MSAIEVASLSSKGQIVIPQEIRKNLHLDTGSKLVVFSDGENIMLRPIEKPSTNEFELLRKETDKYVKKSDLKADDLPGIIKKVRKEIKRSK